jgi:predicted HicB family RNase H-like nuclease
MPIDFHDIADASKKALNLVDDAERRRFVEQFLDSTGPLVEAAARNAFQNLLDEINDQLAPHARIRLIQEGTRLAAEVVTLGEERRRGWTLHVDSDTISKVLVRMPSSVKDRATESAQKAGVSLNSWTVDILERALENLRQRQSGTNDPEGQTSGGEDRAKESGRSEHNGEGNSADKADNE